MPIPETLLADIRQLRRPARHWFSIDDIKQRDHDLEVAARYVHKPTGKELIIPRVNRDLYKKLEGWAARLLENEVRLYEQKVFELCLQNSAVPTPQDDVILCDDLTQYMNTSVEKLEEDIAHFSQYTPDKQHNRWSKLTNSASRLTTEMSVTIPLAGEIARLEMLDSGYKPIDRIGYAQLRIERFFSNNYLKIPHPFDDNTVLELSVDILKRAIRLMTYVVFKKVDEPRLSGFEDKFTSVFSRYLSCSRESSGAVIEQVCALFEPFLKKLAFLFTIQDKRGKPLWYSSLDRLIPGLELSTNDLKETEKVYWQAQPIEDAVLRVAYQLRHKGAHEAHKYPYYVSEQHAYFVFAALLVSCEILAQANPEIAKVVGHQEDVDAVRDLFVRIDELTIGPDGPRLSSTSGVPPTRLEKLLTLSGRAQAIWPNCSVTLARLLESEYLSIREELIDQDREAEIDAYLESMQPDDEY